MQRMVVQWVFASLALVAASCGGEPSMSTLKEGVAGPFDLFTKYEDLTKLNTPQPYTVEDCSAFRIQAVVNHVKVGDFIVAKVDTTGIQQIFNVPQAGDVGLFFRFEPSDLWPLGRTQVTVNHGSRLVDFVVFNINSCF